MGVSRKIAGDLNRSEFTIPQEASRHILSCGSARSIDQFSSVNVSVNEPKMGAVKNVA